MANRITATQWDSKHVLLYWLVGVLFVLLLSASALIENPDWLRSLARDLAIAIGPVWALGILYQHFLFREIRQAASEASADALLTQAQPLLDRIKTSAEQVQNEAASMMHLRELGIERAFRKRRDALPLVCEWLRAEETQISTDTPSIFTSSSRARAAS